MLACAVCALSVVVFSFPFCVVPRCNAYVLVLCACAHAACEREQVNTVVVFLGLAVVRLAGKGGAPLERQLPSSARHG